MKLLGLIGGISWISTVEYYRLINEAVNEQLGGLNFSNCMIYSFNYEDIKRNNDAGDWDKTLQMIADVALSLQSAGAGAIVLCANTMHYIADALAQKINIPIIHIAEETAHVIKRLEIKKVALLGTKFTMEYSFFRDKLKEQGIEAIIPNDKERDFMHYTIFEELGRGVILEQTKHRYLEIINSLIEQGAEGVILGCTEIPLLIKQSDITVPAFDTTAIHAAAAVRFSLA